MPSNPFVNVFRTFGRDELISLFINVIATAVVARLAVSDFILSVSGPVIEKIGFFAAYFKEAWEIFHTTPKDKRAGLSVYILKAIRQGMNSLVKDVLFHDPTYTLLMYLGLQLYRDTPAWIISVLAFFIAVSFVAVGEVTVNEIRYLLFISRLKKIGFRQESYYETRFMVDDKDTKKILNDLSDKFHLTVKIESDYHDRYFDNKLGEFNSRTPKLRLRQRTNEDGGWLQTLQIAYTKASEMAMKKPTQFNFFPTFKDKLWISLDQKMPWSIDVIESAQIRRSVKRLIKSGKSYDVYFKRTVVRDPATILVSIDEVKGAGDLSFTVIELKAHPDKKSVSLLLEAMRYLMLNYPVIQTTHSKVFLASLNDSV